MADQFWSGLLTIAWIHLLAVASPGPDFAVILKNSLGSTRKAAILTAFGIACGIWVHVAYCLIGFSFLQESSLLFTLIQLIGAGYLVFVGIQALRSSPGDPTIIAEPPSLGLSGKRAFKEGFLCNVLNPKATLFFLGVFTLVVDKNTPKLFQIFYGTEMFIATFIWFSFIALLVTNPKIKPTISKAQNIITKVLGLVLIGFAVHLLITIST